MGFSLRLNLWYAALFVFGTLVLFGLAYFMLGGELQAGDRELVRAKLVECQTVYANGGAAGLNAFLATQTTFDRGTMFVEVLSAIDRLDIYHTPSQSGEVPVLSNMARGPDGKQEWLDMPASEAHMRWTIGRAQFRDGTVMYVGRTNESRVELLGRFRGVFLFGLIPLTALGFCGGAFLTYRALEPIRGIVSAVKGIIKTGDMRSRVARPRTNDEIDELVMLFNRMLEKNDGLISAMRESLDNVAHDLRTPLTRLQAGAELALQNGSPEETREALADAVEEAERLNAMLRTIMDISEVQAGTLKLETETFTIEPLVAGLIELYEDVAADKSITVHSSIEAAKQLTADRNRLQLIICNLLDNAIKYTPDGGRVEVSAVFRTESVAISFTDTGVGIASDDLARIWDRLYRADKSRSQRGLGLGLSMVRAFTEAQGGVASVTSEPGRGSTFTITLPQPPVSPAQAR
jgi:signal transduction histidine kinase